MVQFIKRTPDEVDNTRLGVKGRVSYPIIKGFMETGYFLAEVDLTAEKRKPQTMYALITSYVKTHELPVKPLMRSSKLYLMRLDIDQEGSKVENWKESIGDNNAAEDGPPITKEEIRKRAGG